MWWTRWWGKGARRVTVKRKRKGARLAGSMRRRRRRTGVLSKSLRLPRRRMATIEPTQRRRTELLPPGLAQGRHYASSTSSSSQPPCSSPGRPSDDIPRSQIQDSNCMHSTKAGRFFWI